MRQYFIILTICAFKYLNKFYGYNLKCKLKKQKTSENVWEKKRLEKYL